MNSPPFNPIRDSMIQIHTERATSSCHSAAQHHSLHIHPPHSSYHDAISHLCGGMPAAVMLLHNILDGGVEAQCYEFTCSYVTNAQNVTGNVFSCYFMITHEIFSHPNPVNGNLFYFVFPVGELGLECGDRSFAAIPSWINKRIVYW